MEYIQYSLAGRITEQFSCDFNQLISYPIGEKVRVTTNDDKVCGGFWVTFFEQSVVRTVEVIQYDLDEETAELRSPNDLVTFIPANRIAKIEAISHSNPRWGVRPTNKFKFA